MRERRIQPALPDAFGRAIRVVGRNLPPPLRPPRTATPRPAVGSGGEPGCLGDPGTGSGKFRLASSAFGQNEAIPPSSPATARIARRPSRSGTPAGTKALVLLVVDGRERVRPLDGPRSEADDDRPATWRRPTASAIQQGRNDFGVGYGGPCLERTTIDSRCRRWRRRSGSAAAAGRRSGPLAAASARPGHLIGTSKRDAPLGGDPWRWPPAAFGVSGCDLMVATVTPRPAGSTRPSRCPRPSRTRAPRSRRRDRRAPARSSTRRMRSPTPFVSGGGHERRPRPRPERRPGPDVVGDRQRRAGGAFSIGGLDRIPAGRLRRSWSATRRGPATARSLVEEARNQRLRLHPSRRCRRWTWRPSSTGWRLDSL
jgi:hypothetical protein